MYEMHRRLAEHLRQHFHASEEAVPHDTWDFTHQFGNAVDALLYIPLFCPVFIEVEGSVLLGQWAVDQSKRFIDAKRVGRASIQDLERSFNFLEVSYAFSNTTRETDGDSDLLAQFVAESWRGRLALLYPLRQFEVSVVPASETRSVVAVQFCELR
jgi:hypothetical protein